VTPVSFSGDTYSLGWKQGYYNGQSFIINIVRPSCRKKQTKLLNSVSNDLILVGQSHVAESSEKAGRGLPTPKDSRFKV
jgi:hypothetical protein